ncbi:MAG: bifunctional nuclease family protein [Anaerolineae bacterium]|nr:bifunctional nuclease family protein [Anaerolineae bacterium]
MLEVQIAGFTKYDDQRFVILVHRASRRAMPVGVYGSSAWEIEAAIDGWRFLLPYTFESVTHMLEACGAAVEAVHITELAGDILYAKALLCAADHTHEIAIRPNDAVALALRTGSPLRVSEAVFEQACVPAPDKILDDAGLVRIVEENRRKQVFGLDEVVEGVYISGARRMPDPAAFKALGITHVLQLHRANATWPDCLEVFDNQLEDGEFAPKERLARGVEFVKAQRAAGNKVLIACWEGISRSSTFVLAYLVDGLGYDLRDAWRLLRARHHKAWPARELWASLLAHYDLPYTLSDVIQWLSEV